MTDARVFFRDTKPYDVPDSLDDLRGPASGKVLLTKAIYWAPGNGEIDLDAPGGIETAYESVISEGTLADQAAILNRERLVAVWPQLVLPDRARALWEVKFHELIPSSGA